MKICATQQFALCMSMISFCGTFFFAFICLFIYSSKSTYLYFFFSADKTDPFLYVFFFLRLTIGILDNF